MTARRGWTREELLVAFNLYCLLPFGKLHSRNPDIIKYSQLIGRTPSALAMKLSNIASLDPAITSTGRRGLKGTSAADKAMWEEMQSNWERFAMASWHAMKAFEEQAGERQPPGEKDWMDDVDDYTGAERVVAAKSRIGQDFFRRAVLSAYDYRCCITGLAVPQLLVASHIVPWKNDAANRLNPRNGLSLSMLHDKAFDIGIVTISEDMTVRVSRKKMHEGDDFFVSALLDYDGKTITLPEKFEPSPDFLEYHREHVFEGGRDTL
ncbi:MAG TPA: HNH endonuclease [Gammaproteobacteria bacterium]|nr:HNH endonuclease [Gammaproteobacteria bacterium]